ncbi:30S ribosomal protein S8 [Candidatus Dependentiae bacterium]|nr:30S ribosomal protein S8 [Candidatus Dependentiae bacterium]
MSVLDPISDLLTRIKNANNICAKDVRVSYSKLKLSICEVLKNEGYIYSVRKVQQENSSKLDLIIELKYGANKEKVIHGLKQISKRGCRTYVSKDEIPYVMGGYGIAVLTTSKGVMSDRAARKTGVGGEIICYCW